MRNAVGDTSENPRASDADSTRWCIARSLCPLSLLPDSSLITDVRVNGKRVNIPSHQMNEGDVVEVRDKSKTMALF